MLYFGPETYLPLASIAAAGTGVILTFWRRIAGAARRFRSRLDSRPGGRTRPRDRRPPSSP